MKPGKKIGIKVNLNKKSKRVSSSSFMSELSYSVKKSINFHIT